jgi:hypothetical protein
VTKRRWDDLSEAVDHLLSLTDKIDRATEQMQTVLMIREPSSTAAADAYEGLRRQVVATATERRQHLAQLAEFDVALQAGLTTEALGRMVDGWFTQAGLERVSSARDADEADLLFDLLEDEGGPLEVVSPAFVDTKTSAIVRRGRARRRAAKPTPSTTTDASTRSLDEPGDGTRGAQA